MKGKGKGKGKGKTVVTEDPRVNANDADDDRDCLNGKSDGTNGPVNGSSGSSWHSGFETLALIPHQWDRLPGGYRCLSLSDFGHTGHVKQGASLEATCTLSLAAGTTVSENQGQPAQPAKAIDLQAMD